MTSQTSRADDLRGRLGFWALPEQVRLQAYEQARRLEQPPFIPLPKMPFVRTKPGFYELVRHADVAEASRNPALFSSQPTATMVNEVPPMFGRFFGSMINMDDPRHALIRRVVSRAFSPRVLAKMEQDLQARATRIVEELSTAEPVDFVTQVAARLPVEVISDLMGIPDRHHQDILERTNLILGFTDPEYNGLNADERYLRSDPRRRDMVLGMARVVKAGYDLFELARRLGARRRRNPGEDLVSKLVTANPDGESLTAQEVGSFFILLVVAGNETTRNAIAHALHLFTRFPEQRDLLLADFEARIPGAVEEIIRYASPVIQMRRNVTTDCELNGTPLRKGDMLLLNYLSANRDETVFTDPDTFDITRSPNPHLGFGGPGPHYCLGAHLARREITVMLRELFTHLPDIRTTAEPDRLLSHFINGIKHLPFTYTSAGR